jgi:hypothetical protein
MQKEGRHVNTDGHSDKYTAREALDSLLSPLINGGVEPQNCGTRTGTNCASSYANVLKINSPQIHAAPFQSTLTIT